MFEHLYGELEASSEQMCITGTSCEEEMQEIKGASCPLLVESGACHYIFVRYQSAHSAAFGQFVSCCSGTVVWRVADGAQRGHGHLMCSSGQKRVRVDMYDFWSHVQKEGWPPFVHGVLLIWCMLFAAFRWAERQGTSRAQQALGRLPGSAERRNQVNAYLCSWRWKLVCSAAGQARSRGRFLHNRSPGVGLNGGRSTCIAKSIRQFVLPMSCTLLEGQCPMIDFMGMASSKVL